MLRSRTSRASQLRFGTNSCADYSKFLETWEAVSLLCSGISLFCVAEKNVSMQIQQNIPMQYSSPHLISFYCNETRKLHIQVNLQRLTHDYFKVVNLSFCFN
jgi:hypothetical protein